MLGSDNQVQLLLGGYVDVLAVVEKFLGAHLLKDLVLTVTLSPGVPEAVAVPNDAPEDHLVVGQPG